MDSTDDPDDSNGTEPIATEMHDNSWSVNLEKAEYESNPDLAISDGLDAIEQTVPGNHVNLVTHASLGHPEGFLFTALAEYDSRPIQYEYIDQCGCGGHVTRVHVR